MARGQSLVALNKNTTAIEDFNRVLNINNQYADGWAWLGRAQEGNNMMKDASESYNRALSVDPSNTIAKEGMGRVGRGTR
jgi:cytochrome c-type biogenesis protein CcmH/NrfG